MSGFFTGTAGHGFSSKTIIEALTYVRSHSGQSILVKLGGSVLNDMDLVKSLCQDFALVRSVGVSVVLVHGGGPAINEELVLRGIQWEFWEGQRVTTDEMMEVIEMVLCGKVNRRMVRALNSAGIQAVGVSGSDSSLLRCKRAEKKLGNVGVIQSVNTNLLSMYLEAQKSSRVPGMIPVIAPVGVDENGNALNVNADWAASRIAQALGIRKVIYLTDQDGILDGQKNVISELSATSLEDLVKKEVVTGGMLAKVKAVLDAIRNNVAEVHVINAKRPHSLIEELFTSEGVGTVCRLNG